MKQQEDNPEPLSNLNVFLNKIYSKIKLPNIDFLKEGIGRINPTNSFGIYTIPAKSIYAVKTILMRTGGIHPLAREVWHAC